MSKLWATSRHFKKEGLTQLTWRRGRSKLLEVLVPNHALPSFYPSNVTPVIDDNGVEWYMDIQDGRPTFSHRRISQVGFKPTENGYVRTELWEE